SSHGRSELVSGLDNWIFIVIVVVLVLAVIGVMFGLRAKNKKTKKQQIKEAHYLSSTNNDDARKQSQDEIHMAVMETEPMGGAKQQQNKTHENGISDVNKPYSFAEQPAPPLTQILSIDSMLDAPPLPPPTPVELGSSNVPSPPPFFEVCFHL
ncbi:hypothetical protein RFI_10400, partial [Reticulomyxa filosa]